MTDAVFAAGAPAPQVFGVVMLEGRFGLVLQRFDGPTLLQLTRTGAVTRGQAGAILADLCRAVRNTPPPPGVLALRGWMDAWLRSAGGTLPAPIAPGILALVERLQPGDELCHGDLHPGNVIMTAEGPRLVDWSGTVRAPAAWRSCGQPHPPDRARRRKSPTIRSGRARSMTPRSPSTRGWPACRPRRSAAAIKSYLPIVRALVVIGGVMPGLRERLLQRVEAALRPKD